MSIPLIQKAEKDDINTSIIAIKRNIERINMLLGLSNSEEIDTSVFATKDELQDAITELSPVDEVTLDNMQSVTSNAVFKASSPNFSQAQLIYRGNEEYNNNNYIVPDNGYLIGSGYGSDSRSSWIYFYLPNGVSLLKQGWGDENICNCAPVRKGDVVRIWSYLKLKSQGIYFVPCN